MGLVITISLSIHRSRMFGIDFLHRKLFFLPQEKNISYIGIVLLVYANYFVKIILAYIITRFSSSIKLPF